MLLLVRHMPNRSRENPFEPLRQQLARVHVEEVRGRLLKALVLRQTRDGCSG